MDFTIPFIITLRTIFSSSRCFSFSIFVSHYPPKKLFLMTMLCCKLIVDGIRRFVIDFHLDTTPLFLAALLLRDCTVITASLNLV